MPTNISIASNALLLVGDEPISAFTEPGAGATAASNLYPETYRSLLAYHPWSFAFKEELLSQLSEAPHKLTNFKYAYQLPPDLIRLWAVMPHSDYTLVDDLLYSNRNQLLARYTRQVAETQLPPQFTKALEYKLASEFAISVTEDEGKATMYERKFRDYLAEATTVDAQSRPQRGIVDSPFTDVRSSGNFAGF